MMFNIIPGKTEPRKGFPKGEKVPWHILTAGRYGTPEMCKVWGPNEDIDYRLRAQGQAALTLSHLHPDIIPVQVAELINSKASIKYVDPDRVRELEKEKKHDVIAITVALQEVVDEAAKKHMDEWIESIKGEIEDPTSHVGKYRTSADTTQTARAMQLRDSLEILIATIENLRDITIEKMVKWDGIVSMDVTHWYDALPSFVGRPFATYVEQIGKGLARLRFTYDNSIVGKWADATGGHHAAFAAGVDGMRLQEEYCKDLGIGFDIAPSQVPALEYELDVAQTVSRLCETIAGLSFYVEWGRSSDVFLFYNADPNRGKGSAGMPHKDIHGGNPIVEEQMMSWNYFWRGIVTVAQCNCLNPWARKLYASANMRVLWEDGFKTIDHNIRRLARLVYYLELNPNRIKERVERSRGYVTSPRVEGVLTDRRKTDKPMAWSDAHDLLGKLATHAWESGGTFFDALSADEDITSRIGREQLRELTDAFTYVGQTRQQIHDVAQKYYRKKTLG